MNPWQPLHNPTQEQVNHQLRQQQEALLRGQGPFNWPSVSSQSPQVQQPQLQYAISSSHTSRLPPAAASFATVEPPLARLLSDQHSLRLQLKDFESRLASRAAPSSSTASPQALASQVDQYLQRHLEPVLKHVVRDLVQPQQQQREPTPTPTPTQHAPHLASTTTSSVHSSSAHSHHSQHSQLHSPPLSPVPSSASTFFVTTPSSMSTPAPPAAVAAAKPSLSDLFMSVGRLHGQLLEKINLLPQQPGLLVEILALQNELARIQFSEAPKLDATEQGQFAQIMHNYQQQRADAMKPSTTLQQPQQPPQHQPQQPHLSQQQLLQHQQAHQQHAQSQPQIHHQQQPPHQQSHAPVHQAPSSYSPYSAPSSGGASSPSPLIPPSHFASPTAAVPVETVSSEEHGLSVLNAMGFVNTDLNRHLLRQKNGDVEAAIQMLLSMQPTQQQQPQQPPPQPQQPQSHYVPLHQQQPQQQYYQQTAQSAYTVNVKAEPPSPYGSASSSSYLGTPALSSRTIPLSHPLSILEQCGFRPFDFTYRTSAVNHIKSLLRDKVKISAGALANEVWHFKQQYNLQGIQEWSARVAYADFDGSWPWTGWHLVKTQAQEESAVIALREVQRHPIYKKLFLRPLPSEDDPNPISAVRNYLRDRSVWKTRVLEEVLTIINAQPPYQQYQCCLKWGEDEIGRGTGGDKVEAKFEASKDCLRRCDQAMKYIEGADWNELQRFAWLELTDDKMAPGK